MPVAGIAYALVPPFRRWLSGPLLVTGVLSVVLGLVTPSTGGRLEARSVWHDAAAAPAARG